MPLTSSDIGNLYRGALFNRYLAIGSGAIRSGHFSSGSASQFALASGAVNSGHVASGSVIGNAGAGRSIASGTVTRFDIPLMHINEQSGCVVVGSGVVQAIGVGHRLGVRYDDAGTTVKPTMSVFCYDNTTAADAGFLIAGRARGTVGSPTAALNDDHIGYLGLFGQFGTAIGNVSDAALIYAQAIQNWDTSNRGARLIIQSVISGANSLSTRLIFDYEGKVTATTFGSGTINSGAILSGQLPGFELGSGAIVSGHIASGQIGRFHIASGRLAGFELGSGAIVSGRVASGQIGFGHLANESVQSGTIQSGRIFSLHLQSGTIFAGPGIGVTIYASGITVENLSGAGGGASLASGSVQSGHVASGAVQGFFGSTRHIASGTVGVWDFGSGAVITGAVGSGAVQSGNVASGAIGRFHIASGRLEGFELGSGAIVSGRIASGQIGLNHNASGRFQQTCETYEMLLTPEDTSSVGGETTNNGGTVLAGGSYLISRPVTFSKISVPIGTAATGGNQRINIYQASGGINGTANLVASASGISGAAGATIEVAVYQGTVTLEQGICYVLWGRTNSGTTANALNCYLAGTATDTLNENGQSGRHLTRYITNIAASGEPPSTFTPWSGTDAAVSGLAVSLPIIRLIG